MAREVEPASTQRVDGVTQELEAWVPWDKDLLRRIGEGQVASAAF